MNVIENASQFPRIPTAGDYSMGYPKIIHRRSQPLRHHKATKPLGLKESLWVHGGLLLVLWLAISFRIFG